MVALSGFFPMTGVTEQLAQWQLLAPYYLGDGVLQGALNSFQVLQHAPPGMNVDVQTGRAIIQGVLGENGAITTLPLAAADPTNPRIDRVVLRVDTVVNNMQVLVLPGTPAVSPSAPSLVRSATQTDYSLYQVLVGTTVTSVVTANLTDERVYASPRGIPLSTLASATAINPFGITPLTEGWALINVTGTVTIQNIASANIPPRAGAVALLQFASAGCQVTTGGNIVLVRPFTSGGTGAMLALVWDGVQWTELGRSGERAASHTYLGNPTGTVAAATFAAIVGADLPGYAGITMGSLTQSTGVAYTQNTGRATQLGKLWHAYGQITPTATGTAGVTIVLAVPSGIVMNMPAGTPIGTFRIDQASSYVGIITVNGGTGTLTSFQVGTNPATFWGATPSVSLNLSTTLWFEIHAEVT